MSSRLQAILLLKSALFQLLDSQASGLSVICVCGGNFNPVDICFQATIRGKSVTRVQVRRK
jgi:hypothetical protein